MSNNVEEELKKLKKEFIKYQILGFPGTIFLGLGLYGVFGAKGNAFHPFLNDINNCYVLLGLGGVISIWELFHILRITRKQSKLKNA